MAAVIAVMAGVRAGICMIAVPSWILVVCATNHVSGVTASEPYASAVHTEWKPSDSARCTMRDRVGGSRVPVAEVEPEAHARTLSERRQT